MQPDDSSHDSGRSRYQLLKTLSRQSLEENQSETSRNDGDTGVIHAPAFETLHMHTGYPAPVQAREYTINIKQVDDQKEKLTQQSYSSSKHVHEGKSSIFTVQLFKRSIVMALWFVTSFTGIVLNKHLLSGLDVDPGVLGECQIMMTTFFGAVMMYMPVCGLKKSSSRSDQYFNRYHFFKTISILGCLRCGAIICSVVALKYTAVSFSETVKSSAPLFTALIAYILLGEYSGIFVNLSLLPIMFGLAISTSTEISFHTGGFAAAVVNNILDCIQNVFSKKLLSGEDHKFSPLELQFYTSVAASIVQMPFWFFFMDIHEKIHEIDQYMATALLLNGVIFYSQSLFAYLLMSLISPVTFSVSNTVKRACLIWFSVIVFNNKVTRWSAFGTVLVVAGVFLYQRARHLESEKRNKMFNNEKHDGRKKVLSQI